MADFDRFRALSFDCYGTLIDWEAGLAAELVPWAAAHGLPTGRAELVELVARFETALQSAHPAAPYPEILALVLDRIADHLGVTATAAQRESFGASVARWPAFPDSAEALERLHERFRLVILSNVDRRSFAASNERLGVEFDLVITAEDVGSYKPASRNFRALQDGIGAIGIAPTELLHVAQSLFHDHEPAKAAGLPSVWIDRRHGQPGFGATPAPSTAVVADWRFRSMEEFTAAAVPVREE